ncbi:MATE family efflux transporter [Clostridium sp. AM58-1XD]|uniref:MATE family efflux transporter n=1 Tax=Clostridium sp. AM58-1XD TaxID=2292307 RepID=UPI0026A0BDCF
MALVLFAVSRSGISISLKGFKCDRMILKRIYAVAVPSGMMTALPSVMVGILNGILAGISTAAVAVLGVYIKIQSFVYMPANGVIQGLRPIAGYCYGAGKYDRIRRVMVCGAGSIAVIMAFGTLLFMGMPEMIMTLFKADEEMMATGVSALKIISCGFVISSISLVCAGTFEGLGNGMASLVINMIRQFLIIPPLALLLVPVWGTAGVWAAFPVAELLAAGASVFFYRRKIRVIWSN